MRDDRDIQRPKPASAPEKGRGPLCGKDRRSATVCPCRWGTHLAQNPCESVPGVSSRCPPATVFPAKAFQVSHPASHLARNHRESVPGVLSCRPPATESLRKCSRCPIPLPTWHGIPAKAFQVSLSASHLARNPRKSVPGVSFRLPPGTEIPRKRVR